MTIPFFRYRRPARFPPPAKEGLAPHLFSGPLKATLHLLPPLIGNICHPMSRKAVLLGRPPLFKKINILLLENAAPFPPAPLSEYLYPLQKSPFSLEKIKFFPSRTRPLEGSPLESTSLLPLLYLKYDLFALFFFLLKE